MYLSGSDWAETSVIGSQHIGAPKLAMGPRASNRFRRCSVSAVSGGGTALGVMSTNVLHSPTLVHLSDGEGARASAMEDGCHALVALH